MCTFLLSLSLGFYELYYTAGKIDCKSPLGGNMKTVLIVLIAAGFIHLNSYGQPFWIYTEQNSGVTTNLTSASTDGMYYNVRGWVCGSGGIVLKTTNNGTNWINVSGGGIPNTVNLAAICYIAPDTAVTAGNAGTSTYVYRTVNGGASWIQVFTQSGGRINAIAFKSSQLGFMVGNPVGGRWSLWKTTNKGASWDSIGLYIPQAGSETGYANSMSLRHNYILFGTNNTRIYRSTNSGANWSFVTSPEVNSTSVWVHSDTTGYPTAYSFFFSGGYKVFRTTNTGNNWTQNSCPDSTYSIVGFAPGIWGVLEGYPMCAYAVRNNNKIYFAYSGNSSFLAEYTAPAGIYNHLSTDQSSTPGGTRYSFAVRTNGGITRVDYFRGGGIKQISGKLPESFELQQNYPNPFNPVTFMRFAVKNYGLVKVTVFDATGKQVAEPVSEMLKPGIYESSWDASSYPSGAYFYRLVVDGYMETKKMILVK
jgi:photosystem II stability/assembly factor-like uncharacterized protein